MERKEIYDAVIAELKTAEHRLDAMKKFSDEEISSYFEESVRRKMPDFTPGTGCSYCLKSIESYEDLAIGFEKKPLHRECYAWEERERINKSINNIKGREEQYRFLRIIGNW